MIILVVEDKPEEVAKAKEIVLEAGHKVVIAGTLEDANRFMDKLGNKIDGVLTDLHFPESEERAKNNPNGLAVVTRALKDNIPVSVCSDIDHHYAQYLIQVIKNLEEFTGKKIPYTMDKKNWQSAFTALTKIKEEKK